jgi:hypothetical protein
MTAPFITDELIKNNHHQMWNEAVSEHGNAFSVPSETASRISETNRALYLSLIHI